MDAAGGGGTPARPAPVQRPPQPDPRHRRDHLVRPPQAAGTRRAAGSPALLPAAATRRPPAHRRRHRNSPRRSACSPAGGAGTPARPAPRVTAPAALPSRSAGTAPPAISSPATSRITPTCTSCNRQAVPGRRGPAVRRADTMITKTGPALDKITRIRRAGAPFSWPSPLHTVKRPGEAARGPARRPAQCDQPAGQRQPSKAGMPSATTPCLTERAVCGTSTPEGHSWTLPTRVASA